MKKIIPLLVTFLILISVATAAAHGARIEYTTNMAIEIVATYDSGEPMAEAQVTVYSPEDLTTAWLTGTTDEAGHFIFTPDPDVAGTWDVQVRQAGHGDIAHIPIGAGAATSGSSGFTPMQIVLMSASVIWGFVGTALYFSGRKS